MAAPERQLRRAGQADHGDRGRHVERATAVPQSAAGVLSPAGGCSSRKKCAAVLVVLLQIVERGPGRRDRQCTRQARNRPRRRLEIRWHAGADRAEHVAAKAGDRSVVEQSAGVPTAGGDLRDPTQLDHDGRSGRDLSAVAELAEEIVPPAAGRPIAEQGAGVRAAGRHGGHSGERLRRRLGAASTAERPERRSRHQRKPQRIRRHDVRNLPGYVSADGDVRHVSPA